MPIAWAPPSLSCVRIGGAGAAFTLDDLFAPRGVSNERLDRQLTVLGAEAGDDALEHRGLRVLAVLGRGLEVEIDRVEEDVAAFAKA
jgi:hypothetical protein